MSLRNLINTVLLSLFFSLNTTSAQCDYFGLVESPTETCGHFILDFASGQLLEVTSETYELEPGSVVAYSYENIGESFTCGSLSVAPIDVLCLTPVSIEESLELMCDYAECVYPGDSDTDLKANAYDLLNIGLGYGTEGPARPLENTDWESQVGPDWEEQTAIGVNYKHLDCNGDGIINEADQSVITNNYLPEQNLVENTYQEGAPELNVSFDIDSLFIDYGSPSEIEVDASILLGNSDLPVEDLHGLSFMLEYSQDLVPPHSVNTEYTEDSFFGTEDEILWLDKNIHQLGRSDIALTRKGGSTKDGEGEIGKTSFIIVVDIIIGRAERETPFTIRLSNIKGVDGEGNPIHLNAGEDATFTIIDNRLSSVNAPELLAKTKITPNPASTFAKIQTEDLQAESLEIYDITGRLVYTQNQLDSETQINIAGLTEGLHLVHIRTQEGLITRKLMVER